MRYRYALCPVLALAFAGCDLLSGKCTYETRGLEVDGTVSDNGSQLATATMNLSEQRGSLAGQSVYYLVLGPDLKSHVLSASFKDGADLSRVLLDLTLAPAEREEIATAHQSSACG